MCYHVKKGQKDIEKAPKLACSLSRQEKRLEIKINVLENQKAVWLMFVVYELNF